ncbi:acyl-CoA dehydrogenase family protein [Pseudooceanicola sp.]|uniref:acyl-CoA dehydrogenase family protein n=1 Tax=Pseudooceanicola sp. TaxID=1914328 RepID=UPI002601BD6D|nr:acyl-CoA dehydrogenase family protein [Pseudooceanicola sp.]MDF1855917.1 acyl-CoA dehydrogenase family protein [Pseudooceanicola sp.]
MTDTHPSSGSNPDPDTDWNALPEAEFRAHLRRFIDENCPQHLRYVRRRLPPADTLPWYHALAAAGLIAPGWPRIHGGMELSPGRHLVFIEEMDAAGTPWLHDSGVRNLGLAIIAHGTDAQKQRYLPAIHAGDQIWCQGYSEPGAGSDLASLRCAGEIDGDRLTINGQKIWTTSGQHANHMFMLLRTERGTTAHRGITFALVDMATPGITVRPIYNLNDEADFCEVFFDDVTISTDCILGQPHDGWNVARSVLGFERIWAGSPRRARHALGELEAIVAQSGLSGDAVWQDRLVQAEFDTLDAQDLYRTFAELITSDGQVGTEVSALKIFSTETFQRISEWTLEAAGAEGALATDLDSDARSAQPLYTFFESRAPTIFSGTNEIHRNILARRALGLGREDKA